MANNRNTYPTPAELINWFNTQSDPVLVNNFLSALRNSDFAKDPSLNLDNPADVLCYALTTKKIKDVRLQDLNKALLSPGDVIQIVQMIVDAIKIIIDYLVSSGICNKFRTPESNQAYTSLINKLRALDGTNPFINLAGIHLEPREILDLKNANLKFVDLSHAHLENIDLTGANLQYVNLRGAKLSNIRLDNACLTHANLDWVDLSGTNIPAGDASVDAFLKTNFPKNVKIDHIPSEAEFSAALTRIYFEFTIDKLHNSLHRKIDRMAYLTMLTDNILKISNLITDAEQNKAFLKTALNHRLYTHTGKMQKALEFIASPASAGLFPNHDARIVNKAKLQHRLNKINKTAVVIVPTRELG